MKLCVLGCGPAGLLAAHAALQRGHQVRILSKKVKSEIPGAVFLHEAIPNLTAPDPDGVVRFIKHGSKQGYAEKVYGYEDADCSWDLFPEGERPAWSMFKLYDQLWDRFEELIFGEVITHSHARVLPQLYDLVVSTIPAPFLCHDDLHVFDSQNIHVLDRCADPSLDNGIVYNGSTRDHWYRTSKLFGAEATESTVPFSQIIDSPVGAQESVGYKPLRTNCNCYPQIKRIGRFGRWEKGILVHHAYKHMVQLLEEYK